MSKISDKFIRPEVDSNPRPPDVEQSDKKSEDSMSDRFLCCNKSLVFPWKSISFLSY